MRLAFVLTPILCLLGGACDPADDAVEEEPFFYHPDDPPDPLVLPTTYWNGWLSTSSMQYSCDGQDLAREGQRSHLGQIWTLDVEGRNFIHFGVPDKGGLGAFRFVGVRCPVQHDGTFECPTQYSIPWIWSGMEIGETPTGFAELFQEAWSLSGRYDPDNEELWIHFVMSRECITDCTFSACRTVESGVAVPR
jgi:hypothetical protein